MKTSITFVLAAAISLVAAQGPEPTESYGCEPHGDHWHCEGAITASSTTAPTAVTLRPTTTTGVIVISSAASDDHDDHDDHDDEDHTDHPASSGTSIAPSPTESIGCEPHGDHWHCEGARSTTSGGAGITSAPASTAPAAGDSTPTGAQSSTASGAANVRNAGFGLVGGLLVLPFAL